MKHKVFVLNYRRSLVDAPDESEAIQSIGNLENLNQLFEEGWLISNTIQLDPFTGIQSIVYNLELPYDKKNPAHPNEILTD